MLPVVVYALTLARSNEGISCMTQQRLLDTPSYVAFFKEEGALERNTLVGFYRLFILLFRNKETCFLHNFVLA